MTTEHEALMRTRNRVLRWYGTMHAGGHRGFYADVEALEAAIRTQVDEDVRRLVEAARGVKTTYDAQGRYPTIRSLNTLAAALEPFKAVSPTADAKEADRG